MDRMPEPLQTSVDVLPPVAEKTVLTLQIVGLVACGLTAIPALFGGLAPGLLSTGCLVLLAIGLLCAGYGLSLRPNDWWAWILCGVAFVLANWGFPPHWDSAAMVCRVLTVVCVLGGFLSWTPAVVRTSVLSITNNRRQT